MFEWLQKRAGGQTMGADRMTELPVQPVGQGGFLEGTHVASNLGWRPIEGLCAGDKVLTFDHGMQVVTEVLRETLVLDDIDMAGAHCPLFVPRDALNNRAPMSLMPDQGVLLESDLIADAKGDPFAVVPAAALAGYRGIRMIHTEDRIELITLRFARDEVIYLEAGMLGYCPAQQDLLTAPVSEGLYRVLDPKAAQDLVCAIEGVETCTLYAAARMQASDSATPPYREY